MDLTKPENRRAMRAEIAQWCHHIELRETDFIVWFTETHGLLVNIEGEPDVRNHDVEHIIEETVMTAMDGFAGIEAESGAIQAA